MLTRRLAAAVLSVSLLLAGPALAASPTSLFKPGEFKGKKILIASYYTEVPTLPLDYVPPILREMGFTVETRVGNEHLPSLEKYDQLWIISGGGGSSFSGSDAEKIRGFLAHGKGVYVLADNTPYTTEANVVGKALHSINLVGDYTGMKMVKVMQRGEIEKLIKKAFDKQDFDKLAEYRRAGYLDGTLYAEDHELLTGISAIYEGGTICHPSASPDLSVILSASDNQPLVAVSTKDSQRIIYDCGWTRLYYEWEKHAATSTLWYQNVAAYLMGKRRADLAERPSEVGGSGSKVSVQK
jgi:hypothetical protein